jgi:hypothetical protein
VSPSTWPRSPRSACPSQAAVLRRTTVARRVASRYRSP